MSTLKPLPLAYLLRRFRLAAGLSQDALAERAGLSARAISDMERGLRTAPRPESLRALADALSLSIEQHEEFMQAARPDVWRYPEGGNGNGNGHGQWEGAQAHRRRMRPLPIPPTQLIGRDDAVGRIGALLEGQDVRLITLVGPGGVGKTRLAIAVAEQVATDVADGVVFVDLARIREPTLVAHAIAEAIGITSVAMRPMVETLTLALEQRSILLVVDNFEHLLDGATVVSDLMGACPNLEFVVTSRERLHLRGEHVVPVIPLELPPDASEWADVELEDIARSPAVQLFVSRAQAAGFSFELTADNAQAVSEICRRLDGLPLALELAASRIRLLDPDALLTRLDRKLSTLTEGARDAPARHQTMRDTIAWSYGLLSDDEQTLLRRLAVFSGGFSLPAAATVAPESYDIGDDPWAGLSSLVEKSLVNEAPGPLGRPRFSMLEVIREFALDRLNAAQEEHETRRAHAQWFHDLAVEAEGDLRFGLNQFAWFPEIDHELGNLRAAMSWYRSVGDGARLIRIATALDEYWFSHSLYREFMYWLKAGRALDPELDPVVDGWARCLESSATRLLGDIPASQRAITEAFVVAESCGDPFLQGRALLGSALLAQLENDYQRKLELCQEAVPCFQAVGAMNYLALMLVEIGSAYQQLGDSANAAASIDQGIALMRTTGDDWALGMTTGIRGDLSLAEADHLLAAQMYRESIQLSRQTNDESTLLFVVNGLAHLAVQRGDPERALRMLSAASSHRDKWVDAPANTGHLFDDTIAAAESVLDAEAFRQAWEIGRAEQYETALADAIALADEVIGPEPDA